MKRFALRYTKGFKKGQWLGSSGYVSEKHPRFYTKLGMAEKYRRSDQEIVTFNLVEEVAPQLPFTVYIYEYERGWGARHEGTHRFPTAEEADAFCKDYNKNNTEDTVPDYYWAARRVN